MVENTLHLWLGSEWLSHFKNSKNQVVFVNWIIPRWIKEEFPLPMSVWTLEKLEQIKYFTGIIGVLRKAERGKKHSSFPSKF